MAENLNNMNNQIFANTNNLLLEIINDLCQLMNDINDNTHIKRLSNLIYKANNIINQNNKNLEIIKKEISVKFEQIEKKFNELKLNTMNNQEKIIDDGKYVGQTLNGIAEGKGIWIGLNNNFKSEKYEGYWSKDKKMEKVYIILIMGIYIMVIGKKVK